MERLNTFIFLITTTYVLTAFGSNPTRSGNPSKAMQLADAASISDGLYDLPANQLDQYKLHESSILPESILAIGYSNKLFTPPPGLSSVVARNLSLLHFLDRDIKDANASHIIAWMPEKLAQSKSDAVTLYREELKMAATKALPKSYKTKWVSKKHTALLTRVTWYESYFIVTGPRCENWSCRMSIKVHDQSCITDSIYCVRHDNAPNVIGAYPSYRVRGNAYIQRVDDNTKDKPRSLGSPISHPEFMLNMSKHLPDWVHYYVAPISSQSRIPMFLNKGKPEFFQKVGK